MQLYETIFKCKKSKNKEAHVEKLLWVIVFLELSGVEIDSMICHNSMWDIENKN